MLITDRDLLLVEPSAFVHAQAAATVLYASADAGVSGTALTSAAADFAALNIGADHVAVVNGKAIEIISRTSATQLQVSLPRAQPTEPQIKPGDGSNLPFSIITLGRLIDQTQQLILRSLGFEADDPELPLDETDIVNPDAAAIVIGLRTLQRAFEIAAAGNPADASLAQRAEHYQRMANTAAAQASILVDLDGDGEADATRRLNQAVWQRA